MNASLHSYRARLQLCHVSWLVLALATPAIAAGNDNAVAATRTKARPLPTIAPSFRDISYGPHERHTMDVWCAKADGPTPLVIFIHGGGWHGGDKSAVSDEFLNLMLNRGVSVASINYRYTSIAKLPGPVHDAARAIQFLRTKAAEWNLNPQRFAAYGVSAGGCTALWLAYHDDLADPQSDDLVARESSRLQAAVGISPQTSLDSEVIVPWLGNEVLNHPMIARAVGARNGAEVQSRYAEWGATLREFSPITHVSRDDPPVLVAYPTLAELPATNPGNAIHHALFGVKLKEQADVNGVTCVVRIEDQKTPPTLNPEEFLIEHITGRSQPAPSSPADSETVKRPRTILFVDDHEVLYRAGTRRFLNVPVRHARNPLITEDKPWELTIGWTSVHRQPETGKYQLWYQAYAGKRAQLKTHECVVCYAESEDGITFTKPNLGLFEFNGEKNNNIVLLGSGVWGDRYCNSVIVDSRDQDPARRYKMAFNDWSKDADGAVWAGLHVAFSPDGIHWTKQPGAPFYRSYYGAKKVQPPQAGENPYREIKARDGRVRRQALLPMTLSDAADVIFDPRHDAFVIYGKMWIGGPDGGFGWKHGMGRSESKDFLHWSKPQLVCAPDDADGALEFHTSPVFIRHERYFSLNQILNRAGGGVMDIELMVSRDGFEWQRAFRDKYFIPRSPGQQFDSGTIVTNSNLILHGDEMRIYYGAYSSGAIGGGIDITSDEQKSGVGLVTLPLDRFAGIRSEPELPTPKIKTPPNIGQVTLKPLDFAGRKDIYLNANAAGGAVWGELLDEDGYRVPGFDKTNSMPLQEDALHYRLAWKDKKIGDLPPGRYHLRLHLQQAEVFAVTVD